MIVDVLIHRLAEAFARRLEGGSVGGAVAGALVLGGELCGGWLTLAHVRPDWVSGFAVGGAVAFAVLGGLAGALLGAKLGRSGATRRPGDAGLVRVVRIYRLNESLGFLLIGLGLFSVAGLMLVVGDGKGPPMPGYQKALIVAGVVSGGLLFLALFLRQVLWIDVSERLVLRQYLVDIDITGSDDYAFRLLPGVNTGTLPDTLQLYRRGRLLTEKKLSRTRADETADVMRRYRHTTQFRVVGGEEN